MQRNLIEAAISCTPGMIFRALRSAASRVFRPRRPFVGQRRHYAQHGANAGNAFNNRLRC